MNVWSEEWNQERAEQRSLDTMRQVALDAMDFGENDATWEKYAAKNKMTVNELVYYLNAYQYGGEPGLKAIKSPDIIPPEIARRSLKAIGKALDKHFQGRLPYRLTDEGTALGLYEIQQRWQSKEKFLFPVAQFRLTVASGQWHLYWMRKFDAWWPYAPPQRGRKSTLSARINQVIEDEDGCFWG